MSAPELLDHWRCVACQARFDSENDAAGHVTDNPEGHDVTRLPEEASS